MSELEKALPAFKWIAKFIQGRGRRVDRAYAEHRMRLVPVVPSAARVVEMAPRAERRAIARDHGIPFRPVYGYGIPAPDHKGAIHMLHVKDPVVAESWMTKVVVARALVAWGRELQRIGKDQAMVALTADAFVS